MPEIENRCPGCGKRHDFWAQDATCLRSALARRDERIKELETALTVTTAERDDAWRQLREYEEAYEALRPVVREARCLRNAIEKSAWRGKFRYQALCFDRAVRALPPEVRKRIEEGV